MKVACIRLVFGLWHETVIDPVYQCRVVQRPRGIPVCLRRNAMNSITPLRTSLKFPKLPARFAGVIMPFLLSVFMTCIVSMISTLSGVGLATHFVKIWLAAWGLSWLVAFPTLLVVLPLVKRLTAALVSVD